MPKICLRQSPSQSISKSNREAPGQHQSQHRLKRPRQRCGNTLGARPSMTVPEQSLTYLGQKEGVRPVQELGQKPGSRVLGCYCTMLSSPSNTLFTPIPSLAYISSSCPTTTYPFYLSRPPPHMSNMTTVQTDSAAQKHFFH